MASDTNKTYYGLLKHPKWQKKRLEVMENAGFECEDCGSTTIPSLNNPTREV